MTYFGAIMAYCFFCWTSITVNTLPQAIRTRRNVYTRGRLKHRRLTQRLSPVIPTLRVLISRSRALKTRICILHLRSIIVLWHCFITIQGSPCIYFKLIWVFCHSSYNLYLFGLRLDFSFYLLNFLQ